ncbi:MAG: glutamate synthase subunit beta [Saprospiraceae bacterium]
MEDQKGFQQYHRALPTKEAVDHRIGHFKEFYLPSQQDLLTQQSARCMDCGVPFCHQGCPLGNIIPDFNKAVHKEDWKLAYEILSATNNFPEFTGRICPAPCEASCVLNINSDPVTIEYIEKSIIERAFKEGWVQAPKNIKPNGISVAVVGSGPAGMACSDQLNQMGYSVTLYERNDKIGGLLRYGIPDFKLEKDVIDRRIAVMKAGGIAMQTSVNVGYDLQGDELLEKYNAVVLTGGATIPRDLPIKGRNLKGIHYAMDYLEQKNRMVAGEILNEAANIEVTDKNVVVIGGGDTGADCVGTSKRLKAKSVTQIELLSKPPTQRATDDLWPNWPMVLRTSSSHEEGCDRQWAILTKRFIAADGVHLSGIEIVNVTWKKGENGNNKLMEIPNSQKIIPCERAFLAIGFVHPQKEGLLNQLGVALNQRGNVETQNYRTSVENVYAAGDMRRGQSLVVWAIAEGRAAADALHQDFFGKKCVNHASVFAV